jgi:hypothetical protein
MTRPGVAAGSVDDWRRSDAVRRLKRRLAELDTALPANAEAFAKALSPWIEDDAWYRDLIERGCAAMAADPMAPLPLRMQAGALVQGIALAEAGSAMGGGSAMLAVTSADVLAGVAGGEAAQRLVFDSGYSLVAVVAGELTVERWRLDRRSGRIALVERQTLRGGEQLAVDNRVEQLLIRHTPRDAVLLTMAVIGPVRSEPILEYETAGGTLLRAGTADPLVSRMLALLALVDEAPLDRRLVLLSRLSEDADPMLRWQAMRHWLASDVRGAMPQLRDMAQGDADAAVRAAATATLEMIAPMREARDAA